MPVNFEVIRKLKGSDRKETINSTCDFVSEFLQNLLLCLEWVVGLGLCDPLVDL